MPDTKQVLKKLMDKTVMQFIDKQDTKFLKSYLFFTLTFHLFIFNYVYLMW